MALIPCPDCGRQVSPMAKACPECGCGIAAPPPERRVRQDQEQNSGKKAAAGLASGVVSFLPDAKLSECRPVAYFLHVDIWCIWVVAGREGALARAAYGERSLGGQV